MGGLKLLRSALVAGIALACVLPAAAAELKVVAFAGASNWPFWIGQEKGLFKKYGVETTLDITPNSVEMAKNLHGGRYDMALTAIDNIIAYDEGQGEAGLPDNAGFVALFGVDDGMLNVMAKPGIATIKDLKGKTFSVDAMTTGFAFVQRELLKKNGMSEADVNWVKVGGGAQRLEALMKGEQDATLLNTPLDLAAEAKGFRRLMRAKDELGGAYQGIVGAVKRENAPAKRAEIVGFIRGFRDSVGWLVDPANKDEALAIFLARMKGMERPAAEKAYTALTDAKGGIYRDLKISAEGLKTVMTLRSTYAEPKKPLSDPSRYVDDSYLAEALK
ncbi:MAG: transporter substrate-binding protein [Hyphomicrobiales bacterium]|nr:transporter substrate-binding protein [Hyphomicrobiales bacterium]